MSVPVALLLFLGSLAVTLQASRWFARRLDRLGVRSGFPEALVGLLTALAADGPEISSALFALARGAHSVSVGVLVGSNTFNLAAMIGVSGLLAGCVRPSRSTLALEGAVGSVITVIAVTLLLGWIAPALAAVAAACVLIPYLIRVITASDPARPERVPGSTPDVIAPASEDPTRHLVALILVDVTLIVAASAGMVQAALTLGDAWHIAMPILGALVLGPLTSLPNAITGIRLGLARRGEALVGEALNSNTINLAAGVIVPALFVTFTAASSTGKLELWWLVGMMAATLLLLARRGGLGRRGGIALIGLYGGFVAIALGAG